MNEKAESWVVFEMTLHKKQSKTRAVCEQSEWDAMELAQPGHHVLIKGGIATEVEAENLARGQPREVDSSDLRGKKR